VVDGIESCADEEALKIAIDWDLPSLHNATHRLAFEAKEDLDKAVGLSQSVSPPSTAARLTRREP
jgi:hypothetical protein